MMKEIFDRRSEMEEQRKWPIYSKEKKSHSISNENAKQKIYISKINFRCQL